MSRYLSDTAARKLRSNTLPRHLTARISLAGALAHVLGRLLTEVDGERLSVSRRVLMDALALALAVEQACNQDSKP